MNYLYIQKIIQIQIQNRNRLTDIETKVSLQKEGGQIRSLGLTHTNYST